MEMDIELIPWESLTDQNEDFPLKVFFTFEITVDNFMLSLP